MRIVPFQTELRPELPNIYGAKDYEDYRNLLLRIDQILLKSGFEHKIVSEKLQAIQIAREYPNSWLEGKEAQYQYKIIRHALRCNIARHLTGDSYRAFSVRLLDSSLLQWFTNINELGTRKASSKSALERYEKLFDESWIADQIRDWLAEFSKVEVSNVIGLTSEIDFQSIWTDMTCIKAHIHFPVDWILLRDGVKSLILSIQVIRKHGLKHRIADPKQFLKKMNQLCIDMTHSRRKANSKNQRKAILRKMKCLAKVIQKHALRYQALLEAHWQETNLTEAQKDQIHARMNNILSQLPDAIKQAHERIIGGRKIESSKKIISLYDHDAQVIVRGKAGGEVEFGQSLILTEQGDGLIVDWELQDRQSNKEAKMLEVIVTRMEKHYGKLDAVSADRAFNSAQNSAFLKSKHIYDATCPKNPNTLKEQLKDERFSELQTRRSQTEGRIGIFKNMFLGKPLRSRILANKRQALNWSVLSHNLWVLARMSISDEMPIQALKIA